MPNTVIRKDFTVFHAICGPKSRTKRMAPFDGKSKSPILCSLERPLAAVVKRIDCRSTVSPKNVCFVECTLYHIFVSSNSHQTQERQKRSKKFCNPNKGASREKNFTKLFKTRACKIS